MAPGKLRCAIYTRKSTDEGLDQDFNSLEAQRESCTAYVMSQTHEGWEALSTRYDDGGFSGGSLERPALQTLMKDIDKGLVDIVVVYKVDRLTRSLADFAKLVELFDRQNVSFVSVTQAFNTTNSMGRLTLNVLLSFAQFEREVTAERIRDKFRASKEKGMWMGGRPPLGYDVDKRKLVINEAEAEQVRGIYRRYLELRSVPALKKDLTTRDIRSKRWVTQKGKTGGGHVFTLGALYTLLQNLTYIGKIRHKDKVHQGQHQPILDQETWEEVQALLASNRHDTRTRKNAKAPSLLAGLIFHEDGSRFRPRQANKNGSHLHYYHHPTITLSAREVDGLVTSELVALLGDQAELCRIIGAEDTKKINDVGKKVVETIECLKAKPRRDLMLEMIEKIAIGEARITITLNLPGLRGLLAPSLAKPETNQATASPFIIERDYRLKPCQKGKKLIIRPKNDGDISEPDLSLVRIIARAHAWLEDLKAGASYKEIAVRNAIDQRLVARTVRFAFLAPDVTRAILTGREPQGLTSQGLIRIPHLPADWDAQRKLLAFA